MIIANFKAYNQAIGQNAVKIGKKCREASEETGKTVVACPQPQDIDKVSSTGAKTMAQHISHQKPGSNTGKIVAEGVSSSGATGTLINHSERRLEPEKTEKTVERCKKTGLTSIVCAKNMEEVKKFNEYSPDYISIEPPELIGGDKSVSKTRPELIQKAVKNTTGRTRPLTGAGIKTTQDVQKAVDLGCSGVLVASSIIKAEKPKNKIKQLCKGL